MDARTFREHEIAQSHGPRPLSPSPHDEARHISTLPAAGSPLANLREFAAAFESTFLHARIDLGGLVFLPGRGSEDVCLDSGSKTNEPVLKHLAGLDLLLQDIKRTDTLDNSILIATRDKLLERIKTHKRDLESRLHTLREGRSGSHRKGDELYVDCCEFEPVEDLLAI